MRVFAPTCQSLSPSSSKSLFSNPRTEQSIRKWWNSKEKPHFSLNTLHRFKLNELFTLLPTRSFEFPIMNLHPVPPRVGNPISLGYYFSLFPDLYDNAPVQVDGAPAWHAPHTFSRRLRHSGRVVMSSRSPPLVGMNFVKKAIHLEAKRVYRCQETDTPILHTNRKMVTYQWFPMKTDLVNEECITAFYYDKYDGNINTFDGLPNSTERFLSYSFMPTRRRIRDFAMFSQDTHKIHYHYDYAKSEGYPDLVVGTSLQLTIILDIIQAYMPKGFTCNAVEYRVINPLFCNSEIHVFRHWYRKDPPLCLDNLTPDLTAPVDLKGTEGTPQQTNLKSVSLQSSKHSSSTRRFRSESRVLFWTENENGVVGTVVYAALVKKRDASWELDPQTGYILPVGSIWPLDQTHTNPREQKPMMAHFAELDEKIREPDTFDSLGRPISKHQNRPLRAWPSRHPWQQDDEDGDSDDEDEIATLKSERNVRN